VQRIVNATLTTKEKRSENTGRDKLPPRRRAEHLPVPERTGSQRVRHGFSYGNTAGLWELAVIRAKNPQWTEWGLDYTTELTSDVIGYLSESAVDELLGKIEALPSIFAAS
jgi:hypothetical protein